METGQVRYPLSRSPKSTIKKNTFPNPMEFMNFVNNIVHHGHRSRKKSLLRNMKYTVPVKCGHVVSHSIEWEGVSKLLTGTVHATTSFSSCI